MSAVSSVFLCSKFNQPCPMSVVSPVHIQIANIAVLFALSMSSYAQRICSKTTPNLAYAHAMKISPLFLDYISTLFPYFHIFFDELKISQLPYHEVVFKSCSQWKHAASLLLG
jgi:hypothetical protein